MSYPCKRYVLPLNYRNINFWGGRWKSNPHTLGPRPSGLPLAYYHHINFWGGKWESKPIYTVITGGLPLAYYHHINFGPDKRNRISIYRLSVYRSTIDLCRDKMVTLEGIKPPTLTLEASISIH